MEKKNLMFRFVVKDYIKERCEEQYQIKLDNKRTERLRERKASIDSEDKHKYYVFSPLLECHLENNCPTKYYGEHVLILPGDPGEWTDDEDSYAVGLKKISEDYNNEKYLFNLKIYNYEHVMDSPLLDINVYFNKYTLRDYCNGGLENYAQFSNTDDKKTIDKIRNTLSDCIDEAIYDYIN